MAAAYGGCDLNVVGTFFTFAVGGQGFLAASLFVNAIDLCPNYAGMISGIVGIFGCCMGILVPIAVSFLTPNVSRIRIGGWFLFSRVLIEHDFFFWLFAGLAVGMACCFLDNAFR